VRFLDGRVSGEVIVSWLEPEGIDAPSESMEVDGEVDGVWIERLPLLVCIDAELRRYAAFEDRDL
jgi:hypothetical protein